MVDAAERLEVLLKQEANHYMTSDYLSRMNSSTTSSSTNTQVENSPNGKKRKSWSGAEEGNQQSSDGNAVLGSNNNNNNNVHNNNHSNNSGDDLSASHMNKQWREKICEWAYQVVDHFDLHREVVSIAMSHLDRYLAAFPAPVDKNMFHLLSMTCLYLSIKLNEYKHLLIPGSTSSMDTILQLSRGLFTLQQMEKMEYDILQRLQWHVHPPTPQLFVKHFLFLFSVEQHEVHDLAQFMVELSVMDYFFVSYKPSEVAMAALLNTMDRLYPQTTYHLDLPFESEHFSMDSSNVQACRERLALIYAQANDESGNGSAINAADKGPSVHSGRTTSPVSVMNHPQETMYSGVVQHVDESMESEYSIDDDL